LNNLEVWFNTSIVLDCGGPESGLEQSVQCVRTKSYQAVLNATVVSNTLQALGGNFGPTVDNKLVFEDYTQLGSQGEFAHAPLLLGNTANENGYFEALAAATGENITQAQWALSNLALFFCGSSRAAQYRVENGVSDVWRYSYWGNYTNLEISFNPPSGAYHTSEIPMVFGTAAAISPLPNTPVESTVSAYLKTLWAEFAKDPTSLQSKFHLPRYNQDSK
jgi:cholinesterase